MSEDSYQTWWPGCSEFFSLGVKSNCFVRHRFNVRKPNFVVYEQLRHQPACISTQSDQRLCYLLSGEYSSQNCSMLNFNIQVSLCSLARWFESYSSGDPEDRFSRIEALIWVVDGRNSLPFSN